MTKLSREPSDRRSIRPRVLPYPFAVWLVLAIVAPVNGVVRELVLAPRLGAEPANLLSTALLIGAIVLVSGLYFTRSSVRYTRAELLVVGVGWTVLTVGFEFLVGTLEGAPVEEILAQYDVLAGEVWVLVLLTLLVAPLLFGSVLRDDSDRHS